MIGATTDSSLRHMFLIILGYVDRASGTVFWRLLQMQDPLPVLMASSPMTTLSIGGVSPGNNNVRDHPSYETILRLKSWNNQELEFITTTDHHHLHNNNNHPPSEMTVSNGYLSNSSNGLKRKRSELPGSLSAPIYGGGEARIVLGLGQVDDSSSMDEDSGVVLGLGQSDTRNYGSASFCGGDETVHSGNGVSEMLQSMNRSTTEPPGALLRLNSMGDLHSGSPSWNSRDNRQYNDSSENHAGSHLGLGPSTTKFGSSDRGLLLGLGQGAKTGNGASFPVVDEGSSTARLTSGGYMPSLLVGSQIYTPSDQHRSDFARGKGRTEEDLVEHDLLMSLRASASGGTTSTSGASGSDRAPKVCKFRGCGKGPRGASGLCIAHGGGRRFVPILNSLLPYYHIESSTLEAHIKL